MPTTLSPHWNGSSSMVANRPRVPLHSKETAVLFVGGEMTVVVRGNDALLVYLTWCQRDFFDGGSHTIPPTAKWHYSKLLRVLHGPPVPLLPAASSSEHTLPLPHTAANNRLRFGCDSCATSMPVVVWLWFCTFVPFVLSEGVSAHTLLPLAVSRLTALHRWCVWKGSAVTSLAGRLRTIATAWASFRNCFFFYYYYFCGTIRFLCFL